jgi:hypothetical protein
MVVWACDAAEGPGRGFQDFVSDWMKILKAEKPNRLQVFFKSSFIFFQTLF